MRRAYRRTHCLVSCSTRKNSELYFVTGTKLSPISETFQEITSDKTLFCRAHKMLPIFEKKTNKQNYLSHLNSGEGMEDDNHGRITAGDDEIDDFGEDRSEEKGHGG